MYKRERDILIESLIDLQEKLSELEKSDWAYPGWPELSVNVDTYLSILLKEREDTDSPDPCEMCGVDGCNGVCMEAP